MKKRSNRSYGDTESMADLLRMRFEGPRGDKENMPRAVNFFTEHFFSKQLLKVRGDFIPLHDIQDRAKLKKIKATGKASTVTTLSNAAII